MKSYQPMKSAGSTFHRHNHVILDTRDGITPAVCFHEEEVITAASGKQIALVGAPKAFRVELQPEKVIPIVDKTGKPLNRTCTHEEFLLILNSFYVQEAGERDEREERHTREAVERAAALTAAAEAPSASDAAAANPD